MKKALFTTTALAALVSSAGFAAAEVTVSGYAEMGIAGGDLYDVEGTVSDIVEERDETGALTGRTTTTSRTAKANNDATFWNFFQINVDGTGETDNGVTFGFHIEIEDGNTPFRINGSLGVGDIVGFDNGSTDYNGTGGPALDNESVFISGTWGTLTLGEIDGAYDKRLKEVALAGGTIADDETIHAGFDGNSGLDGSYDNQILRYDYDFGDFGVSLSLEQDDVSVCTTTFVTDASGVVVEGDETCDSSTNADIWGLAASYDANWAGADWNFGLGYQTSDDIGDIWGASVAGGFGGFSAGLNYSSFDGSNGRTDYEHWGIGVAYTLDAWTFAANYGQYDQSGDNPDPEGYGLLVNYDLGGGAVVEAGYGWSDFDVSGVSNQDSWSFGLAMSF